MAASQPGPANRVGRFVPIDLVVVIALVVVTDVIFVFGLVVEMPLRIVFGLAFLLFVPGYAFVAAVFPEAGDRPPSEEGAPLPTDKEGQSDGEPLDEGRGIGGIERVVLSIGVSLAIVPLTGFVLNGTAWGIRPVPVVLTVSALTVVFVGIAIVRRWRLPAAQRFKLRVREQLSRTRILASSDRLDTVLNVVLAVSILILIGSTVYVLGGPQQGGTEFYMLSGNESSPSADGYPTELELGQTERLRIGVQNSEHRSVEYTVVTVLQRVERTNGSREVTKTTELGRTTSRVGHGETWSTTVEVTPSMVGEDIRLAFLLYRGDAPLTPTLDDAYREVHLWVDISVPSSTE